MVDMVLDQRAFGLLNRLFHGMQLLRDIGAGLRVFDHLDNARQMSVGAFQPFHDVRVSRMSSKVCHL